MSGPTTASPPPGRAREFLKVLWTSALFGLSCRYALAAVFLMAGVSKIIDPAEFQDRLFHHAGLAPWAAALLAAWLPWLELTAALALVLGHAVREAALILSVLLVALLGYSLLHPHESSCGCFLFPSLIPEDLTWWPPVRNLGLLLCALRVVCSGSGRGESRPGPPVGNDPDRDTQTVQDAGRAE
jgi:uncharacterized membrane protein YphA (DoxX/SURF4 family)